MRIFLCWFINAVFTAGPVWASSGGAKEAVPHGTPLSYIAAWLVLIMVLTMVWRAYKKSRPDEHYLEPEEHAPPVEHKAGMAPVFLMLAVVFLFLTESLSAMGSYHEPSLLGVLRLFIKMGSGVLLMFYGLSFMHGHDEH